MTAKQKHFFHFFLFILLAAFWGGSFVAIKIALKSIEPSFAASLRLLVAFVALYFVFLLQIYWKFRKFKMGSGALFGWLMVLVFSSRFFIEFTKTAQADFARDWPIKMGQILSIPFIALGVFLVWRSFYSAPACADKKHTNKNQGNS